MGTHGHTDNAYFRVPDPLRGIAMWIALDDATRATDEMGSDPKGV